MDYPSGYFTAIIFSAIIVLCRSQYDRDIILTPNRSSQIRGKTLYYRSSSEIASQSRPVVPWEKILKHLSYLTLFNIPNDITEISTNTNYKRFINSTYIKSNYHSSSFGDIITLAEGRLEKTTENVYRFIEGKCLEQCKEKVIAQWLVQKIRHRDTDKTYRYEIKFIINPFYKESKYPTTKDGTGKLITRSFILRDYDYPENFLLLDELAAQQRFAQSQDYLARLHRFNEVFMQPVRLDRTFYTSDNPNIPDLNFGEFLPNTINPINRKIQYAKPTPTYKRYIPPTTYRPNYNIKLSKPTSQFDRTSHEIDPIKAPVLATHLHHHYYVSDNKYNDDNDQFNNFPTKKSNSLQHYHHLGSSQIQTPTPITHQIPCPPNYGNQIAQTPYPIPFMSYPIIPAHPAIYNTKYPQDVAMPPLQIMDPLTRVYHYLYNFQDSTKTSTRPKSVTYYPEPTKPFIQSPKYETVRFSEPDPLYKDLNLKTDNTIRDYSHETPSPSPYTFSSVDSDLEIESPYHTDQNTEQNQVQHRPTVVAQLSAPEQDNDETIPYIETSHLQESSAEQTPQSNRSDIVFSTIPDPTDNPTDLSTIFISSTETNLLEDIHVTRAEPHFKSTTERAVLKWKAKRPKTKEEENTLEVNSLEITKNSSNQLRGKGKYTIERAPDEDTSQRIYTVTPSIASNFEVPTKQSFSTSISIKVGTGKDELAAFIPTISVPNVELVKAKLEQFHTNATDVKLFKTIDKNEHPSEDEKELTQTIVEHAKSLGN